MDDRKHILELALKALQARRAELEAVITEIRELRAAREAKTKVKDPGTTLGSEP